MIVGIGTDIVSIPRIRNALERNPGTFSERVLSLSEREECASVRDAARFVAKRFAAKEAFAKAFGTGLRSPVTLHAVAVAHDDLGKPLYQLNPALQALMQQRGWVSHLSISDEKDSVVAFALIEKIG